MASIERLSGWDYATWRGSIEDPMMRSTMIGLLVLEKAPDWPRLVSRYDRASRTVQVLRKKVIEGPVGIANPRLVVDPNFDLSFHVRRFLMPEGSNWQDVLDEARRQSMTDFDRDRPLWRVTVLEGLPGGKAAVISKLHHAIADGQGALQLGAALVDVTPGGADLGPMPPAPTPTTLTSRHFAEIMVQDNVGWVLKTANDIVQNALPTLVNALTAPQDTVDRVAETVGSFLRYANTPMSPLSPIMTKRSMNYHFATFDFPFNQLRMAAKAGGHTANDAYLASISIGMRKYHSVLGEPVSELNINMPISTRKVGADAQNAVTIARFELPTRKLSPDKLMDMLGATVKRMRAEPALEYANQLGEISRFFPRDLLSQAAQASDVTASNVPGPQMELFLAGARVIQIVPLPPPIGAAVFVAMLTYNGTAYVGLAMDDAAITDRDLLMKCMREGFAEVTGQPVYASDPLTTDTPRVRKVAARKPAAKRATAKKAPAKKPPAKRATASAR